MTASTPSPISAAQPTFGELFTPKLVTILREGYGLKDLRADAIAGLTVAIVALPLSMAIAVASGVGPERGLYTAIVGGFLISLLGGSRFQIGGPAGAFIVLVALIVQREGYDGLVLATLIAGVILIAIGFLRIGTFIKYIPYPVTVGFTSGIAVIIVASQVRDLAGLQLAHEPAEFLPKLKALWDAAPTFSPATIAVSVLSLATILAVHRLRPTWPGFLICLVGAAAATALLHLDVATLGSRFGAMPSSLPAPALPAFTWDKFVAAIPNGLRHRAARRHRVAAVGGDRRRHDRATAPLQLRAGRAGRRQYRLGDVRRHLRHRHDRAHRHQCARRRARADLRAVPLRLPAAVHAVRRAAGRLHPARRARRRAAGGGLEDGGEIRIHRAGPRLARPTRWCCCRPSCSPSSST